ncbi:MAG: histidine phosphatase family protein, partial [Clostridiales bacterium]|nr:histidine phosphatase family protein [Clostridiales bacterium]
MIETTVLLVRHCEAEGNHSRIFQGWYNGGVTVNGRRQLDRLAERMRDYPFDYLYASPLRRAVETARACNRHYGKPIGIHKGRHEINGGAWEGKRWSDFPSLYPEESVLWAQRPQDFVAPGGESMREVYDRMRATVTTLAKRHAGRTICVASHGCAIRTFLCYAKGWELDRLNDVEWCDNTALSVISFDEADRPRL